MLTELEQLGPTYWLSNRYVPSLCWAATELEQGLLGRGATTTTRFLWGFLPQGVREGFAVLACVIAVFVASSVHMVRVLLTLC